MIVDSSALVAILLAQPGHQRLVDQLARAAVIGVGAPTLAIGVAGRSLLARLLDEASIETVPCTAAYWSVAVEAFARYGKGRHRAALNFGTA